MALLKFNTSALTDIIVAYNRISSYNEDELISYKKILELIRNMEDLYSIDDYKNCIIDGITAELWGKLPPNFNCDMDTLTHAASEFDLMGEKISELL